MIQARSPWPTIWLLYACGLLAAAQLGKLSALAPLIGTALALSLTTMAWAISLIEVGGATTGAVAGVLAHRLGLRRTLRWGVAGLALAGLGAGWAQGAVGLIGWRLLEAAGYLAVTVSAPVLIVQQADAAGPRVQGLAMALWSTFVPAGLALGAWASAGVAPLWGWRGAMLASGAIALGLWAVLVRARLPGPAVAPALRATTSASAGDATAANATAATPAPARPAALPAAAWCLALAFGLFALFEVGMLGLFPTLLVREVGLDAPSAGQWTAMASLSAVVGSAAAAWLLRHGKHLHGPMLVSLGLPPLLLFGVFTPTPQAALAIGLALLLNVWGGVFASLAFALLPRLASGPGQLVRANGMLAQCGASGSLLGPPAMAWCVQAGGWPAAALLGLGVSLLAMPLAWRAAHAVAPRAAAAAGPQPGTAPNR